MEHVTSPGLLKGHQAMLITVNLALMLYLPLREVGRPSSDKGQAGWSAPPPLGILRIYIRAGEMIAYFVRNINQPQAGRRFSTDSMAPV